MKYGEYHEIRRISTKYFLRDLKRICYNPQEVVMYLTSSLHKRKKKLITLKSLNTEYRTSEFRY